MAKFLAKIHNKGVLHGHPHTQNWLIDGTQAKLIDAKEVSFKEEYPWTSKLSNRTHTFEKHRAQEINYVKTKMSN